MSASRVAARYAKSLLELAQEKQILEVIYSDMTAFVEVVEANKQFVNLLKSPIVTGDKKMGVLKTLFQKSFNTLTISFFEIIIRKHREEFLPQVAQSFIDQYREVNGIAHASIKTAIAIDSNTAELVKQYLEQQSGKKVDLTPMVDPSLIGGLVIQIEDKLYDASISGKLKKAKQELLNTYISN